MFNVPRGVSQLMHGRKLIQEEAKLLIKMLVSGHLRVEWQREGLITLHTNAAYIYSNQNQSNKICFLFLTQCYHLQRGWPKILNHFLYLILINS